jgi:tripartite ATP-independent transporter DctM subunit
MGIFSPKTISVADLFVGALIPGLLLVVLYMLYMGFTAWLKPHAAPAVVDRPELDFKFAKQLLAGLLPPLALMLAVLGSILSGIATPTEAAAVGAAGATILALIYGQLSLSRLKEVMDGTLKVTSMIFMIFIGAAVFSLVFRGFGGDEQVQALFEAMPGGKIGAMLVVMMVIFLLGFILDFIEITFVVVPIVAPILLAMGIAPVWLGIMIAINLQTAFLTPPFGFALFYLRGVAPKELPTSAIYRGVIPFIAIQVGMLVLLSFIPELATWLPDKIYG